MGKKKTGGNLGNALIKDRFGSRRNGRKNGDSCLHTSELNDGYDWGRLNLQSVTEESSFQEFLSTAELAGTEFQAEKLNIKFVSPASQVGLLTESEKKQILASQEKNKSLLKIPRRPKWTTTTTAEELQRLEKDAFLEWRRQLAGLQEVENLLLTPYEKNLEFWRQLWRVIERSDVIVQIVDARNPLLFRCPDLEAYVHEVNSTKLNMILLNKADFLTLEQRKIWADYFANIGMKVAFFSATKAAEDIKEAMKMEKVSESNEEENEGEEEDDTSSEGENEEEDGTSSENENEEEEVSDGESSVLSYKSALEDLNTANFDDEDTEAINDNTIVSSEKSLETTKFAEMSLSNNKDPNETVASSTDGAAEQSANIAPSTSDNEESLKSNVTPPTFDESLKSNIQNSPELLSRDELVQLFSSLYHGKTYTEGVTTIGLVGYPNVGKSSTINALMMSKKVSVSATPGKTKHFQTLFLDKSLMLCDCPGLVMPSFISTKAEMILNGILPIDQMKDHVPPMNLLGTLIPRHVIEDTYGILLPPPGDGEDPERPPHSEEILNAYGYNRGFMTQNGQPDNPRSSRYLLKDFVNGRLLYCVAPPGVAQESYHTFPARSREMQRHVPPATLRATNSSKVADGSNVDQSFFNKGPGFHFKGKVVGPMISDGSSKPWKKYNKHVNKNKREKLRRIHHHLDLH